MDAVEFLREKKRMCGQTSCGRCPVTTVAGTTCTGLEKTKPKQLVEIVSAWTRDNPRNKRQDEILKLFPDAEVRDGVLCLCPALLDGGRDQNTLLSPKCKEWGIIGRCESCKKEFWLSEVEENEE